jgi:sorting nexin-25
MLIVRKQVNRFLSALSTLQPPIVTPLPSAKSTPYKYRNGLQTASINAQSSPKQFEAFIRSIPKLKSLGEARRLRSDLDRELRTASAVLKDTKAMANTENNNNNNSINSSESVVEEGKKRFKVAKRYVQRLERAKLSIDARIAALSGEHKVSQESH